MEWHNFMTLGYSGVGKTYFLGSLHALTLQPGKNGFFVKDKNLEKMDYIKGIYRVLVGDTEGGIYTTTSMQGIPLIFQQGLEELIGVTMTDIEGQTTDASKYTNKEKEDAARALIKALPRYNGVLIFVKAPNNENEVVRAIDELNRHLNLTTEMLKGQQQDVTIPVALVISQIDRLSDLRQIKESIDQEYQKFKDENLDEKKKKFAKGDITNSIVGKAAKREYINRLVAHFKLMLKKAQVESRPFLCSSLGFDNSMANPKLSGTDIAADKQIHPYGTVASFLWMIYAWQKANPSRILNPNFNIEELKEDLKDLYVSGQAYYDDTSSYWTIQDL